MWRTTCKGATLLIVTGTKVGQARAGTLELSAYHLRVPWTGERLRDARARRGWTQDDLRRELAAVSPDGRGPSKTSIVGWEKDVSPQAKWDERLTRLFADDPDADSAHTVPHPDDNPDVDLSAVDDLHLLAEVARRMAVGNRPSGHALPTTRLRWDRSVFPSARHADEQRESRPDSRESRA